MAARVPLLALNGSGTPSRPGCSCSKNPATLKPAELKKACAVRGLSPMGYPDELLESLMTHLKSKGTGLVPFASATVDMRIEYTSRVPW